MSASSTLPTVTSSGSCDPVSTSNSLLRTGARELGGTWYREEILFPGRRADVLEYCLLRTLFG